MNEAKTLVGVPSPLMTIHVVMTGVRHRQRIGVAQVDLVLARASSCWACSTGMPISSSISTERRRRSLVRSATERSKYEPVSSAPVRARGRRRRSRSTRPRGTRRTCSPAARPARGCDAARAGGRLRTASHRGSDVTEDPGDGRIVVVPRQQLEGLRVRPGQNVCLLDPAEAIDARSRRRSCPRPGVVQLGRGDVEPLGRAEDVGEPQLDEADTPLLDRPQYVVPLALHPESLAAAGALSKISPPEAWTKAPGDRIEPEAPWWLGRAPPRERLDPVAWSGP